MIDEGLKQFVKLSAPASSGIKHDQGKPPITLIPRSALESEAQVMAYGAMKYDRDNWRGGMNWSRCLDAAMRHILAFVDGENVDRETAISHLAHARCCLAFVIEYQEKALGVDDRYGGKNERQPAEVKVRYGVREVPKAGQEPGNAQHCAEAGACSGEGCSRGQQGCGPQGAAGCGGDQQREEPAGQIASFESRVEEGREFV